MSDIQFESDEQIFNRSKQNCVICFIDQKDKNKEDKINRTRLRGNYCGTCNSKAGKKYL